jgi:glycosyltransferase involved in cell wall biosynthesis
MDISVVICTYNRCENLRQTLSMLCELEIPPDVTWELLVVDNNSTDGTRHVCESFVPKLPLRYLFEPRQGVNCARNRGVAAATTPLVLFTDDDVNVDKHWLAALWDAAKRHTEASYFGGRIFPLWEKTPPAWLIEHSKTMLKPIAVYLDLGDEEKILADPRPLLWSGNLAFRKSVFGDSCKFREDVGRIGNEEVRAGETELMSRLLKQGHRRVYVPSAIIHHRNPPSRGTERYLFAHYKGSGITAMRVHPETTASTWFGAPRYYWWKLARNGSKYVISRWTRRSKVWLRALIEMARAWGMITELRRVHSNVSHYRSRS